MGTVEIEENQVWTETVVIEEKRASLSPEEIEEIVETEESVGIEEPVGIEGRMENQDFLVSVG